MTEKSELRGYLKYSKLTRAVSLSMSSYNQKRLRDAHLSAFIILITLEVDFTLMGIAENLPAYAPVTKVEGSC